MNCVGLQKEDNILEFEHIKEVISVSLGYMNASR